MLPLKLQELVDRFADNYEQYKHIVNRFNVAPPALARATAFFDNFAYFAWELCTNNPTAQNMQNSLKNSSSADRATLNRLTIVAIMKLKLDGNF
jgi:hypothetical protein